MSIAAFFRHIQGWFINCRTSPAVRLVFFLCALAPALSPRADTVTLNGDVIINEVLAAGADTPPEPPTNWTFAGFDDALWLTGPGGLGYGDGDDATDLQSKMMGKVLSLYLRQSFQYALPDPIPNHGFETGAFAPWTVTGTAWSVGSSNNGLNRVGFQGSFYAESIAGGEASTGTLRSTPFILRQPAVEFSIAGHSHQPGVTQNSYNYVTLRRVSDGHELARVYAPGQDAFTTARLDGSAALGEPVCLEVVDDGTAAAYAWLAVDDFRPVDQPTYIDNFESGALNPALWTATGNAWRVVTSGQGYGANPSEGRYAAKSSYNGSGSTDALTGTLTSQPVTVPAAAKELVVLLAGHDGLGGGAGQVYLDVCQAGSGALIHRFLPPNTDDWSSQSFDITPYRNTSITFKAVDQRTEGFGWLGIDALSFSLLADAPDRKLQLRVDYDDGFVAFLNGVEVARRNLGNPGTFVACTTPATASHEAGTPETIEISPDALRDGENVLAIQVHNNTVDSTDLSLIADLDLITTVSTPLVRHQDPWRYFVGNQEPVGQHQQLDEDGDASDWIELYNRGASLVSLAGWSLTDNSSQPRKWLFPSTTLAPGKFLLVFASGKDRAVAGKELHANFKLDQAGECLALFDATTAAQPRCVFAPTLPAQRVSFSFGRTSPDDTFRYLSPPTPGEPNDGGNTFEGIVADPEFNQPEGFYPAPPTIVLTDPMPEATITYTTDGRDPLSSDPQYRQPLGVPHTTVLRARAERPGWIPSRIITRTYIVAADPVLKTLPAISLVGDPGKALYEPNGVMAIVGGSYASGIWQAVKSGDYNNPMQRGEAYERPANVALLDPTGGPGFNTDCGLRISGSEFIRPRYQRSDKWLSWEEKFSFRLYFRSLYGPSLLDFPLIPAATVDQFNVITLRAGHNDHMNPFIRDELTRRLAADTGQIVSLGTFANLFVNGEFKGYYNPVERYDESFFQTHTHSLNEWDVIKGNPSGSEVVDGDAVKWNELLAYARTNDLSLLANYQEIGRRFDLPNFVDYLLVNAYAAMGDWPENNWVAARERTPAARFAFYCWDGEYGFGNPFPVTYDTLANLATRSEEIPTLYRRLLASPEFRLLFADRIQKHFFRAGGLTDANIFARHQALRAAIEPMIQYVYNVAYNNTIATDWVPQRRARLLQQFTTAGVWPSIQAPTLSRGAGMVDRGTTLTLANPNVAGNLYYTLDGSDPRQPGTGATTTTAKAYQGAITIQHPLTVKARVRNGTAWSPLAEAAFKITVQPDEIIVSEFMANAAGDDTGKEWIELYNATGDPVDLNGWSLASNDGQRHTIANNGPLLVPAHGYCVLGQSADRSVNGNAPVAYAYGEDFHLDNNGGEIILRDSAGRIIFTLGYGLYSIVPTPIEHLLDLTPPSGRALGMGQDYAQGSVDFWRPQVTLYNGVDTGTPGADNDGVSVGHGNTPHLVTVKPARRDRLLLLFTEPLARASVGAVANYSLTGATAQPLTADLLTSTSVLLILTQPLDCGTTCTLTVTGVRDEAGAVMVPAQASVRIVTPPVTINEIMYNNRGPDCEWVELLNTTGSPIDISNWCLSDADAYPAQSEGAVLLPPGTTIQPHEYLMVNLWNTPNFSSFWQLPPDVRMVTPLVLTSGSLANEGDNLALFTAATGGVLVDGSLSVSFPDLCQDGESLEKIDELMPWGDSDTVGLNLQKATVRIGCGVGVDDKNHPVSQHASPGRQNGSKIETQVKAWSVYE